MIYSKQFFQDQLAPIAVYAKLKTIFKNEISYLFESAGQSEGNYSFICIGARERVQYINNQTLYTDVNGVKHVKNESPFDFLKNYYKNIDTSAYKKASAELKVGYVDGFIGYIGYDMVKVFEPKLKTIMENLVDEFNTPDLDLILPKIILVYSHKNHQLTLISTVKEMSDKFAMIEDELKGSYEYIHMKRNIGDDKGSFAHTKEHFFKMVDDSKEMIKSGDVFQILMTNRFTRKIKVDPFSFYRILRTKNPSPYMFLMEYEDFNIVGSSPEVMVRLIEGKLLLRPIAGTRKRGNTKERDKELEYELLHDPKELSEHLMLIDLGRNDVSRVAKTGSVKVEDMMHIERFSHVMHIVSDVTATIADDKDMFDLFMATFTAGTMTGAPKIRAMELIAEYEGLKRGFYSGSVGYFGFDGNMDSAITIRTAMVKDDKVILQAGAGVVADSKNELEYLEVKNKLGALVHSLEDLD
ncbi:MAG: anthranilate synthase component I [Sulfurimonas sp. RIFOXYD12_FULL_33_39]|uniref:anthranilate synthase component I family protein n=1 Tax=unclassified Sulfurimonas TaxID=2623549 RepID=UPI0008ABEAFE|nr:MULTISPECIES: anthranilate synthase component I family protein [unclassified Sulfurimonas]OHE09225.1 MAG: anthranilate synthase component I [Sulfurimonas sp. RIFOXYD12_FULL_33_39]OHE12992.1 MAG: anthranilate synthase component I [Sulfurimonas sp. RIFOXYD2_FULL_34_21]